MACKNIKIKDFCARISLFSTPTVKAAREMGNVTKNH